MKKVAKSLKKVRPGKKKSSKSPGSAQPPPLPQAAPSAAVDESPNSASSSPPQLRPLVVDPSDVPLKEPGPPTELHRMVQSRDWESLRSNLALAAKGGVGGVGVGGAGAAAAAGADRTSFLHDSLGSLDGMTGGGSKWDEAACPVYRDHCTARDVKGRTPLHSVLTRYHDDDCGPPGSSGSGRSPRDFWCAPDDVILGLASYEPLALAVPDLEGMLPLHYGAKLGHHASVVGHMIEVYPPSLSAKDDRGKVPLEYAFDYAAMSKSRVVTAADTQEAKFALQSANQNRWATAKLLLGASSPELLGDPNLAETPLLLQAFINTAPPAVVLLLVQPSAPIFASDKKVTYAYTCLYLAIAHMYPLVVLRELARMCPPKSDEVRDETGMGLVAAQHVVWCYEQADGKGWRDIGHNRAMIRDAIRHKRLEGAAGAAEGGGGTASDEEFRQWWDRMKFLVRYCRGRARLGEAVVGAAGESGSGAAAGDGRHDDDDDDDEPDEDKDWHLLHHALSNPDTPPEVVHLVLSLLPRSAASRPLNRRLPLHVAADALSYTPRHYERPYPRTSIELTLAAYPRAAGTTTFDGILPLHIAVRAGKTWAELKALVRAERRALRVMDWTTKLYPFQMMSTSTLPHSRGNGKDDDRARRRNGVRRNGGSGHREEKARFTYMARNDHTHGEWKALTKEQKKAALRKVQVRHDLDRLWTSYMLLRSDPGVVSRWTTERQRKDAKGGVGGTVVDGDEWMNWYNVDRPRNEGGTTTLDDLRGSF